VAKVDVAQAQIYCLLMLIPCIHYIQYLFIYNNIYIQYIYKNIYIISVMVLLFTYSIGHIYIAYYKMFLSLLVYY